MVKIVIGAANLACDFVPGYFSGSLSEHHRAARYDVVSKLRCVQTDESGPGVFYSRTSKEGLFLHDYGSAVWAGVMLAIDEFRRDTGDCIMLMSDKSESVLIRKPH